MKYIIIAIFIVGTNFCFSQITKLEIVTIKNDTIKDIAFKRRDLYDPRLHYKLQDEIVYLNRKLESLKLQPSEVKSFNFKYGEEIVRYESMEGKLFALVMYSNKLRLLRYLHRAYTPVDIYVIQRPNGGKTSFLEAKGLSRRIALPEIKRGITDCPQTIEKVENDILKIHGEAGVVELIQDYELSCY